MKKVNEHEKIRPYLREHPFKPNRTMISVAFQDENGRYYIDGSVAYVSLIKGKIFYDTAKSATEGLLEILEEPFEEAVKILQNTSPKNKTPPGA